MENSKSKKIVLTPSIEKESNSIKEIKIDELKKKKQTRIMIDGIEIYFPYPPYECQLNYMSKVIEALNNKSIAALESPTGTGKTLCLLCSTLGWVNAKRKELIESSSDKKVTPPVIYYSTRTHSQISNVIKELKKTIYLPKICTLSSRDNLCVNKVAKESSGASLNIKCKVLRFKKECRYFTKTESMYGANNNDILDIEELIKNGINKEFCPFYFQRNKLQKCEMVFLPYNYIFDHRFRSALKIDLKASNAVLLIDEAHNILNSLESAKTFELSYKILEDSVGEIKNLKTVVEKHESNSKLSYIELKEEENILVNIKNYLKKRFQPKTSTWPNIGQKLNPEEFFKIFFLGSREDDQKRIDEGNKITTDGLTPKNIDIHIDRLNRIESEFVDLTNKSTILTSFKEFLELFEILYKNYTENKDDPVKIKSSHIFNYKIFIHDEDDSNDPMKGKSMNSQSKNRVLSLFCFNPGYAFNEILETRNNGIIITSGTLSPIEGLESELKCQFAIKLENKHVIDQNQVHFSILPYSPRIKNLTYSLDSSNRNNVNMQEDLGNTIIELCKITPGGVLVFFTAFHYLKSTINLWQEKNILNQIEKYKEIFNDTQNADKNKILLESFRKNSSSKGYRGGILFSVLKGKCSEGIDFSDDLARLVIVIGIPYANLGDVKVQLKKEYLGESHNTTFRKITPGQWYTEEATRAVNQALGRVIRHVDDYGVMVLIDQRYIELNNKKYFSSWLRQIVKKYGNSDNCEIFSDVSKFFTKMTTFIRDKKAKEIAMKNSQRLDNNEIIIHTNKNEKETQKIIVNPPETNLKRVNETISKPAKTCTTQKEENLTKIDENNLDNVINSYNSPNKKKLLIEKFKQILSQDEINQMIPNLSSYNKNQDAVKNNGKLECQICFEMSENNLSGDCGHIYCGNCWNKLLGESNKAKCPACKKVINKKKLIKVFI